MKNVLIVDGDRDLRHRISRSLRRSGYRITAAADFTTANKIITSQLFDVIISDTRIQGGNLSDLIIAGRMNKNTMMIVAAAEDSVERAVQAVREGAVDIIKKPFSSSELEVKVQKAIELKRLRQEADCLRGERNIIYRAENFIGESPVIKRVFEIVEKVAKSNFSVLLTGEAGTGKELIAGAIHYNSLRPGGAFVKVNCAALSEQLLERELFGYKEGAFSGADQQRIGRFEQADGGTIFLDEIGEIGLATQAKLLRLLEEREFQRVGNGSKIRVDVRILSATNKDLMHEIEEGRFRADLFYRLSVVTINIAPLRERRGDILLLTYFFLRKFCGDMKKKITEIHPLALKHLTEYSWPGNIRELENTIERAVIMAKGDTIKPEDLSLPFNREWFEGNYDHIPIPLGGIHLEKVEKALVVKALKMCDWTKEDASKLLGITKKILEHKIKRFGITHPSW